MSTSVPPTRAQRDAVVDQLREAVSRGVLTTDEFLERLDAAYSVSTWDELYSLLSGIPRPTQRRNRQRDVVVILAALGAVGLVIAVVITLTTHSGRPVQNAATCRSLGQTHGSLADRPTTAQAQANLTSTLIAAKTLYAEDGGRYTFSTSQGLANALNRVDHQLGVTTCVPNGGKRSSISVVYISTGLFVFSTEDATSNCWMIADNESTGTFDSATYNFRPGVKYGWVKATASGRKCLAGLAALGYTRVLWRDTFQQAYTPSRKGTSDSTGSDGTSSGSTGPASAVVPATQSPAAVRAHLTNAIAVVTAVLSQGTHFFGGTGEGKALAAEVDAQHPTLKLTAVSPVAATGGISIVLLDGGVLVMSEQDVKTGCWMVADNTTTATVNSGAYNFPEGVSFGLTRSTRHGEKCFIGNAPAGYPLSSWKSDFKTLGETTG